MSGKLGIQIIYENKIFFFTLKLSLQFCEALRRVQVRINCVGRTGAAAVKHEICIKKKWRVESL